MARIDTAGQMNSRPTMGGVSENKLTGTADYGNTSAKWDASNTDKLQWNSGEDPSTGIVTWDSWSKYEGWINTRLGLSTGRYLWGEIISGCQFEWRTYPNQNGGIALRRWGIGIAEKRGNSRARWSSNEIEQWSTSSSFRTISYTFDGTLANRLNNGWVFDELHFMVRTPSDKNTPSSNSKLEIRNFRFHYKNNNAIIPAMRTFANRAEYPIA